MEIVDVNSIFFDKKSRSNSFYHYTSADSLLKIVTSSSLWFTDCSFLNDKEEYNYINSLIEELKTDKRIGSFLKEIEIPKENYDYILEDGDKFKNIALARYYVLSGSTNRDSLPMWNYFVKNGDYIGYAIRFNVLKLAKGLEQLPGTFLYGNVIYNQEEQVTILRNTLYALFDQFDTEIKNKNNREDVVIDNLQNDYWNFVQQTRLFFKSPGFNHENEFRIALLAKPCGGLEQKFSIQKGVIRPHLCAKYSKGLPIMSITMSPTIEKSIGEEGLIRLLDEYKKGDSYKNCKIKHSEINLRY